MPTSVTAGPKQLSDGNAQGTTFGQSAGDRISFYNVTPVSKQTIATTAASVGAQTASSAGFGASTAAIMTSTFAMLNALVVDVAAINAALRTYGLNV